MTRSSVIDADNLRLAFEQARFRWPFRRYQTLALEAYENREPDHLHRCYLVMPPGSGKTALGLEIIRRAGNPAVVFCPNTAVQLQWEREWSNFQSELVQTTLDPSATAPLSFLTYQSLCNLDPEHEDLDEVALDLWQQTLQRDHGLTPADALERIEQLRRAGSQQFRRDLSRYRRRARQMIARGDDPERLLDLLHENGKQLVEQIRAFPRCTIVLDECHHLLELWGYLVQALVDVLGEETLVVGLTATPPREMNEREDDLYRNLFGYADFEVPTPAVVKEGDLAPYQELGYLTRPLPAEADYIATRHLRFEELITRLFDREFATVPFLTWIEQRVQARFSTTGARVSWVRFERDNPELAGAALKLCHRSGVDPPPDARLREPHRQAMTADDWVVLIEDYAVHSLRFSNEERDQHAWEEIREALPSLGYVLTSRGIRRHVSPIDRVLAHSASKGLAAATILDVEHRELGPDLRALVLCDYERTNSDLVAQLRGVLDAQAGSAILLLETLLNDPDVALLNPLLMTARTVACSRETAERFRSWLANVDEELAGRLTSSPLPGDDRSDNGSPAVTLTAPGGGWNSRDYVPLITRFYEEGGCQCLVGTRGLLGEGWNARRANVLIDLTTASTATAVHQMRGRTLRLDPELPEKVANNWDVICIDPDHPRGTADYERFVRKHQRYYAPNREGEIESGVSHVHHALSPFGPPDLEEINAINANLLTRATERIDVRETWRIGEPYENREVATVRVHIGRSFGVPNRRILRDEEHGTTDTKLSIRGGLTVLGSAAALTVPGIFGLEPSGWLLPPAVFAAGTAWTLRPFTQAVQALGTSDHLEDFGLALLEALRDAGELPETVEQSDLRVGVQEDGYYRCYIAGVSDRESELFATALDDLLAPPGAPRYIIPRYIADTPTSLFASIRLGLRQLLHRRSGSSVVYHAVPDILAQNRERVSTFEAAWHRHVSAGDALFYRNPEAQAILQVQAGEDLFDVTAQMRTLWR